MAKVEIRYILYILPAIMHFFGIYLLYCSRRYRQLSRNQYLYVLNLSIIELVFCLVFVSTNAATGEYILYLKMFRQSFLYTWLLLIMILLTGDRFLEVYLNIRYLTYCSITNTKRILYCAPVVSMLTSVFILVASKSKEEKMDKLFDLYVNQYFCPILNAVFLFVALFTYGYILKKIRIVRRRDSLMETVSNSSAKRKRFLRRIYMPTFLVITFFWFYLVPDFVNLVYRFYGIIESDKLQDVHYLAHWVSFVSDAVIYTLATKQVRKTIHKMMYQRLLNKESQYSDNSSAV